LVAVRRVRLQADREYTIRAIRILLATHGTRGNVQPMIAPALALRARGHGVAFVAPANFV
jgi:hypothetical protein